MSGDVKTLPEALSAVMGDVQSISKDQRVNEGPARFNFRGVDDVMKAVGPALRRHGVIFAPSRVVSVEHERYQTARGSQMDGVTVLVEYTITGPGGDTMTAASAGQAADSGDKAVPKAMSVAYRTVLLQSLCIPTDEPDPDTFIHERGEPQREPSGRDWRAEAEAATDADQIRALWKECVGFGEMTSDLAEHFTKCGAAFAQPEEQPKLTDDDPWTTPGPQDGAA